MDGEDVFIERHGLAGEQLIEVMAGLRVGGANVDIVCDLGGFGLGENTLPPVHGRGEVVQCRDWVVVVDMW